MPQQEFGQFHFTGRVLVLFGFMLVHMHICLNLLTQQLEFEKKVIPTFAKSFPAQGAFANIKSLEL